MQFVLAPGEYCALHHGANAESKARGFHKIISPLQDLDMPARHWLYLSIRVCAKFEVTLHRRENGWLLHHYRQWQRDAV
jgi:hypothetical protein